MNSKRSRRLIFLFCLLFASILAASLIIFALRQNMNLFYTPTDAFEKAPINQRIRVGGMVEKGSLKRGKDLELEFVVTDYNKKLKIKYNGILPDLFREGQGVVAQGVLLSKDLFMADLILAKHDENYMPPELDSLKKNKEYNIDKKDKLL